jgi:hypothetical protein
MKRGGSIVALGLCLLACDAGEVVIFATTQAGIGGTGGNGGASGGASAASGASPGGTAGRAGSDSPGGAFGWAGTDSGFGGGSDSAGAGAGAGAGNPFCVANGDCGTGYFCSKQRCWDVQGVCALTAFPDPTEDLQVCGCDGVTYWNDSYRQRFGIAASTMGPCNSTPATCLHDQDCGPPHGYRCEHLLAQAATCGSPPSPGRCWVIPRDCVTTPTDDRQFQICPGPNGQGGSPPPCVTKCEAIQSGLPFTQLGSDQVCP